MSTSIKPFSDRPLHVVVYTDARGMGGAEISLGHLISTVSRDIRITVVGVCEGVVAAIAQYRPQATTVILPDRGWFAGLAHVHTFLRLQPDVIHVNLCTPWACTIGLSAALLLPQVRVLRVDQLPLRTTAAIALWRTRALALRVDAHVAVGEASARRMEDFYALGRNTVISIPNGVPDQPSPSPQVPADRDRIVVGSVGRLDAMKAHDLLLRAVAQVEGVDLVILGDGNQRQALAQLAQDLGVSDRLTLTGWVSNPRDALPSFDVVALPSRSEGFPLAMVEAMLAARPVIATRVGSMPEAIRDGETGLLIEKDDMAGLMQALRQLRDDAHLRAKLGNQARDKALACFTVEAMTDRYEQLWHTLLTRPRASRLWVSRPPE